MSRIGRFGPRADANGIQAVIPHFRAQPVDEVARAIADLIDHPRAELYTRPEMATLAARWFTADDVAIIEAGPPFAMPRR